MRKEVFNPRWSACIGIFMPTALLPYRTACHKPPRATVGLLSWTLETTAANWGLLSNNLVTFQWALLFLTATTPAFSQMNGVFSFRCRAWFYSADVVIAVVFLFYSDQLRFSEGGLIAWKIAMAVAPYFTISVRFSSQFFSSNHHGSEHR